MFVKPGFTCLKISVWCANFDEHYIRPNCNSSTIPVISPVCSCILGNKSDHDWQKYESCWLIHTFLWWKTELTGEPKQLRIICCLKEKKVAQKNHPVSRENRIKIGGISWTVMTCMRTSSFHHHHSLLLLLLPLQHPNNHE